MGAVSEPCFQAQVEPVIEYITGSNSIIPAVLGFQFYLKWDRANVWKGKHTAVLLIGIEIHAANPKPKAVPE